MYFLQATEWVWTWYVLTNSKSSGSFKWSGNCTFIVFSMNSMQAALFSILGALKIHLNGHVGCLFLGIQYEYHDILFFPKEHQVWSLWKNTWILYWKCLATSTGLLFNPSCPGLFWSCVAPEGGRGGTFLNSGRVELSNWNLAQWYSVTLQIKWHTQKNSIWYPPLW